MDNFEENELNCFRKIINKTESLDINLKPIESVLIYKLLQEIYNEIKTNAKIEVKL
jgi:hypothetical protein